MKRAIYALLFASLIAAAPGGGKTSSLTRAGKTTDLEAKVDAYVRPFLEIKGFSGRSPGFQGEIHRYVDDDVCVIVLSNNYSGAASFMITDLAAMVFGEPQGAPTVNAGLKIDPKVIDGYLGRYEGGADFFIPRATINIEKRDGNLSWRSSAGAAGWLTPMTESKFYERIFGASVTFVKDDKGKVSHLIFSFSGSDFRANKAQTE